MSILYDKLLLFCCCFLLMLYRDPYVGIQHVVSVLIVTIFTCISFCLNAEFLPFEKLRAKERYGLFFLFFMFTLFILLSPSLGIFFPFLLYEIALFSQSKLYFCIVLLPFISFHTEPEQYPTLIAIISSLAYMMKYKTNNLYQLERQYKLLQDTTTERNLLLNQKNKNLLEKQDYEIHVATLKERNRIAREIHDNVGHLLSRSLLQAGALMAVNSQKSLEEPLIQLKDTLSSAMDSIRKSVHNLHDESIDLQSAVTELLNDFSDYNVNFEYDMEHSLPQNVKYCFLSIIKESLSNINRHSNADRIDLNLREHPSLYQLIIKDNGSYIQIKSSGIGLNNMKERVDHLDGHFTVDTENGFRIFVSIPRHI